MSRFDPDESPGRAGSEPEPPPGPDTGVSAPARRRRHGAHADAARRAEGVLGGEAHAVLWVSEIAEVADPEDRSAFVTAQQAATLAGIGRGVYPEGKRRPASQFGLQANSSECPGSAKPDLSSISGLDAVPPRHATRQCQDMAPAPWPTSPGYSFSFATYTGRLWVWASPNWFLN